MGLTLYDCSQEIQIVEVVVAEGIALGRYDAHISIREVLIGGTIAVGGNHEVLSVGSLHHLYAAGTATRMVWKALGQIDSPIAIADAGHTPDDGVREACCSCG